MADIGNQLEGTTEGLDRFLDALDNASIKLGSNAALEAKLAREQIKAAAQEKRDKLKIAKLEKTHFKQLGDTIKSMKLFNKSIGEMGKGMIKGLAKMGAAAGKAGAIGALVVGVKFLIDGLLKVDKGMADLVKRTKLTRVELAGVKEAALAASQSVSLMGPTFEQITAEAGNLVETFGKASMVTETLLKDSLALQQGYGVAAAEAGKLTEALARSSRDGEKFRNMIRDIAGKDGTSASLLMRSMAGQAQQIAIQSERGTEAMAKMASEALAAGISMNELSGVKGAFQDIDSISENMGRVSQILGPAWAAATMDAEQYWALNMQGETGRAKIQEDMLKGAKEIAYLDEQGNLRLKKGHRLFSESEGYIDAWAAAYGRSNEALQMQIKEHLKVNKASGKTISDAEHLETVYRDQLGVLEYFEKIITNVFGKITTAFSEALGIDSSEGGVRKLLQDLESDLEVMFNFGDLRKDMEGGKGGLAGFIDAIGPRLQKVGDYLFEGLKSAFERAINWFQENYEFSLMDGGFVKTSKGVLNDWKDLQDAVVETKNNVIDASKAIQDHETIGAQNLANELKELEVAKKKATTAEEIASIEEKKQAAQSKYERTHGLLIARQQDAGGAFADASAAQGAFDQDRLSSAATEVGRQKMIESMGTAGQVLDWTTFDFINRGVAQAQGIDLEAMGMATIGKEALGGIGGRRLSLVGEGGAGEVVISRSALRSGIGVGGRAASALAGIGVPGYRTGYAERSSAGIHGRQGLGGALGSQSGKAAVSLSLQQEQVKQQAAMVAYWRNTYDEKMDALVEGVTVEKPKGPPWLATFFLKYNKEIGAQLKKANAGPELEAAFMQGMTKWAQGGSLSDAMKVGARAGIVAGINDPNSKLNEYLKKTGELQGTLTTGLAAIAEGKSFKSAGRAMVGQGMGLLSKKIFGDKTSETAAKYLGTGFAAKGKYVNSPTLMMVGEGGASEVVIPTERIRKGLPINAGVARELGSIGVPGFEEGGLTFGDAMGSSGAGAMSSFTRTFQDTGDWKQASTAAAGTGIGMAAGFGLNALGIPPPLSGMIGNAIGGLAQKGLNKIFNITGGYKKGRRRAVKLIEDHIKTGGRFDYGAPGGLPKAMNQAIGGYEKTPTEANFQKLVEKLGTSKMVSSMGVPAPALVALGTGKMRGEKATKMFAAINQSLYGSSGDKYRKALAVEAVPSLGSGGVVNRPTTALIGERGPEAVVPLGDSEMMQEMKKQNKLMAEMIKTQKETAKTEIRMDGRLVSEVVGENFYDIGTGL